MGSYSALLKENINQKGIRFKNFIIQLKYYISKASQWENTLMAFRVLKIRIINLGVKERDLINSFQKW